MSPSEKSDGKWSVLGTANNVCAGFLPAALTAAFIGPVVIADRWSESSLIILIAALVTFPVALITTICLSRMESVKRTRTGRWAVALFPLLWALPFFAIFTSLAVE